MAERPVSHFLKIIVPCILEDERLRIPDKFVSKYGEELSDVTKVVDPTGHSWEIGLTRDENNIWFDDGWQKFVEHHSIGSMYLLLFRYRGPSDFSVCIYGKSACEIQYPINGPAGGRGEEINSGEKCSVHDEKEMLGSGTVSSSSVTSKSGLRNGIANQGESSRRNTGSAEKNLVMENLHKSSAAHERPNIQHLNDKRKKKLIEENIEMIEVDDADESKSRKLFNELKISGQQGYLFSQTKADKSKSKTEFGEKPKLAQMESDLNGFPKASEASKRAVLAATIFKPEHPSFMAILQGYNIHSYYLNVPPAFARKYLSAVSESGNLQVSDGEWPVKIIRDRRSNAKLSKGWGVFLKENSLKEGDVCVFEYIKGNEMVLKVTIFRADEDGGSLD